MSDSFFLKNIKGPLIISQLVNPALFHKFSIMKRCSLLLKIEIFYLVNYQNQEILHLKSEMIHLVKLSESGDSPSEEWDVSSCKVIRIGDYLSGSSSPICFSMSSQNNINLITPSLFRKNCSKASFPGVGLKVKP